MSASISLLRSRRKVLEDCDDSGEESDCSIKDAKKKESIEKDARAIAAINMLTVSMVNQLLEKQGLDPFGKPLGSPSLDEDQSWSTPMKTSGRQSITRSIKENTLGKKSRKSVRFTPDCNKSDFTPERSCDADRLELTHTKPAPLSALKMEPKFTPLRRSKALKAGLLRSLENEQDVGSVDNFVCVNDSFDSPLPIRTLAVHTTAEIETTDDAPLSPVLEAKSDVSAPAASHVETAVTTASEKPSLKEPATPVPSSEETLCEGSKTATDSKLDETEDGSAQDDLVLETPVKPRWTHHFDPTSPEHMSPFLKTLLEERAERSQGKEHSKSLSMLEDSEDQPRLSVLKGVVAFVEVRRADEDRSSGFRWKLKQLGAQVEENFTKKVTHVVFQEGLLSTYRRAKDSNVHLVSAFWVMACDESSSRVPEDKYPIDEEDKYSMLAPLKKYIRRPKLMSPNLGDDNDEKRLARRLQAIKRRSMKIEGAEKEANDGAVAHSSKTSPDSKTPQRPKRASLGRKCAASSTGSSSSLMNAWLAGKKKQDVPEIATCTPSTWSPRKRNAEEKSIDSPVKKKAAFDSPVKAKLTSRYADSPVKTKSTARSFDSPVKVKSTTRSFDSPVKANSTTRSFDSTVKAKSTTRSFDSPVKAKSTTRSFDSPVKANSTTRSFDSPVKAKYTTRSFDSPVKANSTTRSFDSPVKAKSTTRSFDSPVKAKSTTRSFESPVKAKSTTRSFESPVKAKSTTRSFDSPVKAKSTTRSFDSPVKAKSSTRSFDSPVKAKSSTRSFDPPVKANPSTESFDSSVKAKSITRSFDSPKKPKLNANSVDSKSSTSVASSARSQTSSESSSKRTPEKYDFDKRSGTPTKNPSSVANCTIAPESRQRLLRSTPNKTAGQSSSTSDVPVEVRTPLKITLIKTVGKGSITSWLSANKVSLTSPAKRSLSGVLKGVTSSPAQRYKSSSASKTQDQSKDDSALERVVIADLTSPVFFEAPKKKARVGSISEKKVSEEKGQRLYKSSPKKKASSGTAKLPKSTSGGPSQSKDKRKTSPREKAAMKNKRNDKSQTVMTSHFRPLFVSPFEDTKVKAVTDLTVEPGINVCEENAVLAPSTGEDRTRETSPSRNEGDGHIVMPLECRPSVVNTSVVIDGETPSCSSTVGYENRSSAPPISTVQSDNPEESQIISHESDDSQRTSLDLTVEKLATAEVCEAPMAPADLFEEQRITVGVIEEQPTADGEIRAAANVDEDQPTADEEPRAASIVDEDQPTADEEPRAASIVDEDQPTAAGKLRAATDVDEKQPTAAVLNEARTTVDVDEEPPTADVLQAAKITADVGDEEFSTSVSAFEEPRIGENVSEGQAPSADLLEERLATPVVSDVQPATADLLKERTATPVVSEEQPASADLLEERGATPIMCDEQPASAGSLDGRPATPVIGDEQPVLADFLEERVTTPVISDEQPTSADTSGKTRRTSDSSEGQSASSDKLEETRTLSDVSEKHQTAANELPDRSSGSVSRDTDGSCDSFSYQALPSSGKNTESSSKRTRKSIKPRPDYKQSHYRTRRSMRFVASDVTD